MTATMNESKAACLIQCGKRTLIDNLPFWLIPTIAIGTLGSVYALIRPSTWQAVQALVIRDETVGELAPNGRFSSTDARKAAQEMVTQIARNRTVIRDALKQYAAANPGRVRKDWPREADIQLLQDEIKVTAPKGAELGQSDLVYLSLRARSAHDAVQLNIAICDQLERYLQELRNRRAESVIQELTEKIKLTEQNLNEATERLETMERDVGSDLGELRTLNQTGAGESNLRTALNQIKNDLRNSRSNRTAQLQQLEILLAASEDPTALVATPNRLLEAHPGLRRLKEGLIDAQLRVAELMGKMNEAHPDVKAALNAEAEIRQDLHGELETSIRGLQADLQITDAVIRAHEKQLDEVQGRLDRLAALRARYGNLVEEVSQRSEQLRDAQRGLAEALATREASQTFSLITRVDTPDPGDRPVGPGRLVLLLVSWSGGFAVGIGCMLLLTPAGASGPRFGRRWTDRRTGDVPWGRRETDQVAPDQESGRTAGVGRRATDRVSGIQSPVPSSTHEKSSPNDPA
jgi:uncharacterized protein involved in exopolysaccharide biosynthesis